MAIYTIIIDNKDSFTFNIAQMVSSLTGRDPVVLDNSVPWREIRKIPHDNIIISPGPGNPATLLDVGTSMDVLRHAACPILGVCLGHQCIVALHGGVVDRAPEPFHGRLSIVEHNGDALFAGVPQGFAVTRYHSLIANEPLPASLECIAWSDNGLIMSIRHKTRPIWGVQFHPESICSQYGSDILANFFSQSVIHRAA